MKNSILHLLVLAMFYFGASFLPGIAKGQSFSHPSTGLVVNGDLMDAASGNDFIAVVYSRSGEVFYNQLSKAGTWTGEHSFGPGTEARLAIDNSGHPHMVFTTSGQIAYLKHDGNTWSQQEFIVSNNAGACSKPDIGLDSNNYAHITYTDTKGNVGDYTDRPDIMYAVNSSGTFVKELIFRGYLDYFGGADRYAEYFDKGSLISVDGSGNYYIIAHKYQYQTWMGGNDKQYSIIIKSNLGTGGTSTSSSDVFSLYDMDFNGTAVFAMYRQSTFKISELSVSGTTISFINTTDITASSVSSFCMNGSDLTVGGISSQKLLTRLNDLSHVYENVTVKGSVVSTVNASSVFYSVYTDNADGKIKIREVAGPLSFTRFEFASQTGPAYINGQTATIDIEVQSGTALTGLVATFTNTSDVQSVQVQTIAQTSAVTSNDFSSLVTYSLSDGVTTRDWTVSVTVEPEVYSISAVASPAEGGSVSGAGETTEGSNVTLTATANTHYAFLQWVENDEVVSTNPEYTFVATADRNLTAVFIEQYTLTIQTTGTGTVKVNDADYTDVITVNSGTLLNLQAAAGDEYHFTGWSGDLSSTENPASLTMDGNKVVQAVFEINQYTLSIQITGTGTLKVNDADYTDVITVNSGTILNLEAVAGDEYHFIGWSGDLSSTENPASLTMNGNKVVQATFEINQYTLTIQTIGTGMVKVNDADYTDVITVNSGTLLNLQAVAGDEYHFTGWDGDLSSTENPASLTMNGNKVVQAIFEINQYTLTIQVEGSGTVEVNNVAYTGVITAASGTSMNLNAVPGNETGWEFTRWMGDNTSTNNPISIIMNGDRIITAEFSMIESVPMSPSDLKVLYPNPFENELNISHDIEVQRIVITNLVGQKVLDIQPVGRKTIATEVLKKGMYIVNIELIDGRSITQKIVKK